MVKKATAVVGPELLTLLVYLCPLSLTCYPFLLYGVDEGHRLKIGLGVERDNHYPEACLAGLEK
jgi:hypothetical protein